MKSTEAPETIGTRIKRLRKDRKLTQKNLANLIGVSDVTIGYWEKEVNKPDHDNLQSLASILEVPIDYIRYGYGSGESSPSVKDFRPVTRMLPILSNVQAGVWTSVKSVSEYEISQWLPAPANAGKNSYYLIVQGTSNYPFFHDGDYICIDPDVPVEYVQTGEMIVAQHGEDMTFKALVRENNRMYLQALNPNFSPNIIDLVDGTIYKGKYVGRFEPPKKFL
ncbi:MULTISPECIES: LexA family protein [unclassified Acinetobacter]|uniref:LexA family protein n=1 Tax=unclassified Acinetobacter TaxID=196816 RepID=UPI00124FF1CF|nr:MULTISPECIES: S24 family peptidase [unclassified Acinetobacter]